MPKLTRAWLLTAMHVAAFAQLGVLTRLYLDKLFQDGCSGGWGLCLTSTGRTMHSLGAYFTDLPSNMLGSYIMGCLATSAALGLSIDATVGILPRRHPWQRNGALLTGLRTGFCGSLTTFSAWQLQDALLLIGGRGRLGGQWANALWSVAMGMFTSLGSLVLGEHTALLVHRWLLPDGRLSKAVDGAHPTAAPEGFRGRGALLLATQPGGGRPRRHGPAAAQPSPGSKQAADSASNGHTAVEVPPAAPQPDGGSAAALSPRQQRPSPAERRSSAEIELGYDEEGASGADDESAASEAAAAASGAPMDRGRRLRGLKTHCAVAALLAAQTALFTVLTVVDTGAAHITRRGIWLSVLMGPFGALLRWLLADWNFQLPGAAAWFPAGTFAANLITCVIIYAAEVANDVTVLGYWPKIVVYAIQKGFCGALSTVSTFVNEVNRMFEILPDRLDAYAYILLSFGAAWLAGILVYGAAAWAHM